MKDSDYIISVKDIAAKLRFLLAGFIIVAFTSIINANPPNVCDITKVNGGGFSTTISSVTQFGGQYIITLTIDHDGCGGPTCKELSHFSIEADNGTFSNVSWNQVWGDETMGGHIEMSLGNNDPFDGFKLDDASNIGDGDAGQFTMTYTLTYLQDQQTLAKAGNNYTQIAAFTVAEFQQVLNCGASSNNPPVAVDDAYSTNMSTPVSANVTDNDSDPDGDDLSVNTTAIISPSHGSLVLNANGTFTYTPTNGYTGTDTFKYEVCDDGTPVKCDQAWVTITMLAGPTAVNDNSTTSFNTAIDVNALNNDIAGDAALDPTSVTFINGTEPNPATEGTFTVNATSGLVTFTPINGFSGTVSVNYSVCDLNSICDIATIIVVVLPPLAGPTAHDDNASTMMNNPININALDNDVAGSAALNPGSVVFIPGTEPNPATEGTFTVSSSTGLVTFTPVSGFTGTVSIDYQVCDMNSLCSIATITVNVVSGTDSDGDNVPDTNDDYPNDPSRAFNNYYPAGGYGTLAYEDLWPSKGDYDFNDLVILYRFNTVTNASNFVVETFSDFTIKAFGAGFQNGFGFQLPNSSLDQAKITSSGSNLGEAYVDLGANGLEQGQSKPTFILYDNSYNIMTHPGMGIGVNTEPWATYVAPVSLSLYIDYDDNTYTLIDVDIPNFNPFIMVNLNRSVEVHLPDYPPTDLVNQGLFGTWDDNTSFSANRYYKTENYLPWAINLPVAFEYPIEKQDIIWVYLKFADWAESDGQTNQDWYLDLPGYRNNTLIYDQP
jgi:LruC domain-containing protein